MSFTTDFVPFEGRLRGLAGRMNLLDLPGPESGDLVADLHGVVATHHVRRAGAERGPEGAWAALSPAYLAWKARHGFPTRIGVLTGEMLDEAQFRQAPVTAGHNVLIIWYGVTAAARRKMIWFHRGTRHQPARPALGPDPALAEAVGDLLLRAYRSAAAAAGFRVRSR